MTTTEPVLRLRFDLSTVTPEMSSVFSLDTDDILVTGVVTTEPVLRLRFFGLWVPLSDTLR